MIALYALAVLASVAPAPAIVALASAAESGHVAGHASAAGQAAARRHARWNRHARVAAKPGSYYSSCKKARAAGVAPMRRGAPGYRPGLDRNNNGIACE
ncbi:excalibur calcium-binding domain-containing protein [Sphingomonas sp. BK069]|uniref:excalibur calcium-binding domain-containing protein n=1 Tax=Sphingomonas sp. BK069 TaxID=2586979 RepID=UPI001615C937|nr:excalibur calcium-binding domain-containing protein [Sphingomonas sp. BK069]MBB3346019.1 hypothetical protein [Sphingomonas sp. BK069]